MDRALLAAVHDAGAARRRARSACAGRMHAGLRRTDPVLTAVGVVHVRRRVVPGAAGEEDGRSRSSVPSGRRKNAGVHFIIPRRRAWERAVAGGDGRSVGSSPDALADSPRVVAEAEAALRPSASYRLAVDGDAARRPAALVVADHVHVDPVVFGLRTRLRSSKNGGVTPRSTRSNEIGCTSFGSSRNADRSERIDDLVGDRTDRVSSGADRSSRLPRTVHCSRPRETPPNPSIDPAVGVLAEAEVRPGANRRPWRSTPRSSPSRRSRTRTTVGERVDDLVVQAFVGSVQRPDVVDHHADDRSARPSASAVICAMRR